MSNSSISTSPETSPYLISTSDLQEVSVREMLQPELEKHFGIIGGNKIRKEHTIPPLELVKRILQYNPETGFFTWKIARSNVIRAGKVAGSLCKNGYRYIGINQERLMASHLAWYMIHGEWPTGIVDHINGQKDDNCAKNLRLVTKQGNALNNRAKRRGDYGVFRDSNYKGKYRVQLYKDGKHYSFGSRLSYKDACEIARRERIKLGV